MSTQKVDGLFTQSGEGASDLTGKEYYFAQRTAAGLFDLAGDSSRIVGVISEGKAAGYHTSVNTKGNPILKALAGEVIAIGDEVQSNSFGKAKSGSTNPIGIAITAAVAGELVEIDTDAST